MTLTKLLRLRFQVLKAVIAESLSLNSWEGMWHLGALVSALHKTVMIGITSTSVVRQVLNRLVYSRIVGLFSNTDVDVKSSP